MGIIISGSGQGRLDIHEGAVRSYIREGGEVADLLNGVARDGKAAAAAVITGGGHIRSGRLLKGLYWNRVKPEGPLTGFSRLGGSARHTAYVNEGTGTITAHGAFMIIPRNRRLPNMSTAFSGAGAERYAAYQSDNKLGKGVIGRKTVRGQSAKKFLQKGRDAGMAAHGLK